MKKNLVRHGWDCRHIEPFARILIPETVNSPGLIDRIFQPSENTILLVMPSFRGESIGENSRLFKKPSIAHELPNVRAAAAVKPVPRKFLRSILLFSIADYPNLKFILYT
jgi:hypothetical protein